MRVLIVSNHFPTKSSNSNHGVHKRLKMFIEAISDIAEIDVLFFVPRGVSTSSDAVIKTEQSLSMHFNTSIRLFLCERFDYKKSLAKWRLYFTGAFSILHQPNNISTASMQQVHALESCLCYKPDAIFVHRLSAMSPILVTRKSLPPIFFDLDDIEHLAFKRGIRYIRKAHTRLLNYFLLPALFWGQYRSIHISNRTFVCSEVDRRLLVNRYRLKGVVSIPNAVRIPDPQPIASEQAILFIGSYFHKPNIDAAEFLIKEIWPQVHAGLPSARLIIAGSPHEKIPSYRFDTPGIRFTGFAADLDGLYRKVRVVCAPILSGSGTRVKIIEAAAYGKAIVSTVLGAEGIEMNHGHEIFLHDDPSSFAKACIKLLSDPELCDRMGSAARAVVVAKYNKTKVQRLIQKNLKTGIIHTSNLSPN